MNLAILPWWFWGILVACVFGLIMYRKGTSGQAGTIRNLSIFGIVGMIIFGAVAYPQAFAVDDADNDIDDDIVTDYTIVWVVDSSLFYEDSLENPYRITGKPQ